MKITNRISDRAQPWQRQKCLNATNIEKALNQQLCSNWSSMGQISSKTKSIAGLEETAVTVTNLTLLKKLNRQNNNDGSSSTQLSQSEL